MAQTDKLPPDPKLFTGLHVKYIQSLDTRKDQLDYWLTEHLRLNGVYWGLTALHLLGRPDALPRRETIDFVLSCQHENGGFGAAPGHDAHMLSTVSAVQILGMVDGFDELEARGKGKEQVGKYIAALQNRETGTFEGDEWGEEDTRFLYGALNALSLLGLLSLIDLDKAAEYVVACANFDGGYGVRPGAESHSGQVLTCVAALAIAGRLDLIDQEKLGRWLSERQTPGGGLNGRPEKKEDVCYSWWVFSSLYIIGRGHWIDQDALANFILDCQDPETGGISDRPGDMVDVWHTCFGIAGLSLLGYPGLEAVDPVYYKAQVPSGSIRFPGSAATGRKANKGSRPTQTNSLERTNIITEGLFFVNFKDGPLILVQPTKRKTKRSANDTTSQRKPKVEDDVFADLPSLPPLLHSPDNYTDDFCLGSDVLSLKGQIWPGMGKMDLANEEMKRTRNQRKPKSVIDKMRRTSEGIEPTQVIMTPKLEVQRVKDVYDEASSPVSGREETVCLVDPDFTTLEANVMQTPPRKAMKPRRKKTEPLAEISVNVKRGTQVRHSHNRATHKNKSVSPRILTGHNDEIVASLAAPWETLQPGRALFSEEDAVSSPFDEPIYNTPKHRDYKSVGARDELLATSTNNPRLGIRERLGVHTLNPIARSNFTSPRNSSKVAHGHESSDVIRQERSQTYLFGNQNSLSSLGHNDTAFSIHDDPVYNTSSRIPHSLAGSFHNLNHEHFHGLPVSHAQIKQENYGRTLSDDAFPHPTQPYLNISGGNPLLSQGRGFLDAYDQSTSSAHFPCLGFTPINRDGRKELHERDQKLSSAAHDDLRLTKDAFEATDAIENFAKREPGYHSLELWATGSPQDDLGGPE
ncbi:putative geranylgeranyl transferase type-2 subunit beta [Paramyrothecium foliicola]|nr:putative geranylgeranyl transferase type-2 subunit beta [Paramyrothecium foliicola]